MVSGYDKQGYKQTDGSIDAEFVLFLTRTPLSQSLKALWSTWHMSCSLKRSRQYTRHLRQECVIVCVCVCLCVFYGHEPSLSRLRNMVSHSCSLVLSCFRQSIHDMPYDVCVYVFMYLHIHASIHGTSWLVGLLSGAD